MSKTTKEIVLGQTYTDRFSKITGPAMEVHASAGGCFQIGIQLPPKEDGEPGKMAWAFDSHLDDENGKPVRRPDAIAKRTKDVLGKEYRDPASGLRGTAINLRFLENGTEQIGVQPRGNGTEMLKAWSIDSILLEEIAAPKPVAAAPRIGAPARESPRF